MTGSNTPELLRVVCERDPEKPSVVARPATESSRELRGDLDAIVLKAMRKEPERRYVIGGRVRRRHPAAPGRAARSGPPGHPRVPRGQVRAPPPHRPRRRGRRGDRPRGRRRGDPARGPPRPCRGSESRSSATTTCESWRAPSSSSSTTRSGTCPARRRPAPSSSSARSSTSTISRGAPESRRHAAARARRGLHEGRRRPGELLHGESGRRSRSAPELREGDRPPGASRPVRHGRRRHAGHALEGVPDPGRDSADHRGRRRGHRAGRKGTGSEPPARRTPSR